MEMNLRNPQRSVTLTDREEEDLLLLAEFLGDKPASLMREAFTNWHKSPGVQALIQRAKQETESYLKE